MAVRKVLVLASLLTIISVSCKQIKTGSLLKDVYKIDGSSDSSGNSRRHEAGILEINWTIRAPGCSGILLNPDLILTAAHCKLVAGAPIRSGFAVSTGSPNDMVVSKVLEENKRLDYAIASVSWTRPMPSQQTFPPWVAISPEQIFASQLPNQGDVLFSVGFPDDKSKQWNGTYSEGQAKSVEGSRLNFNIGLINGNSGGAVLKKDNLMLTAIAIGGSKKFGDAGWDQANADNPDDWNYGTNLWAIYGASETLRKAFPNGRNEYLKELELPRTSLYIAVDEEGEGSLLVSGNIEAEKVLLCPTGVFPCTSKTSGVITMKYEGHKSGRRFYSQSLENKTEQTFGFIALDKDGNKIGSRHIKLQRMGQ